MHAIFSLRALKNVEPRNPSEFCESALRGERRWLTGRTFAQRARRHNKCATRARLCHQHLCASHTLFPLLSRPFNSCTLSAFGEVLSYTILRRAARPPFLASSSSSFSSSSSPHFLLARAPTLSTPFSFTSAHDPSLYTSSRL